MVYPTESLERFVLGLLEDSSPESFESNGRLISIEPEGLSRTMAQSTVADLQHDTSSDYDFPTNHEPVDSDLSSSGVHSDGPSANSQILDAIDEESLDPVDHFDGRIGSSTEEICSFQIMDLLDRLGAPRNGYDRLIALLRKQKKHGFKVNKAIGRETLMNTLKKRFPSPGVLSRTLDNTKIFFFPFTLMLQDLLDTMKDDIHVITMSTHSNQSIGHSPLSDNGPPDNQILGDELWDTDWMKRTFHGSHRDFNDANDVMLPLILYMDKTGTDAYQRYSLEPLIFSLGCIRRDKREDRKAWRHMGFLPSTKKILDAKEKLHFYHRCLAVILEGLHAAQQHPPLVRITLSDGSVINRRARLPVMLVMGDQLPGHFMCPNES